MTPVAQIIMPEEWRPQCAADLIGPARNISEAHLAKAARLAKNGRGRLRLLLYGAPGSGKSEIARFLAESLAGSEHNRESVPGRCVSFELAQEWLRTIHQQSFFSGWPVRVIEEIDTVRRDAQDVLLQVLDDLPSCRAILGTSNLEMGDLSERFQTRFQVVEVERPDAGEIAEFLSARWPMAPRGEVELIAKTCKGNVRAALLDLQNWFDAEWEGEA